MNRKVLSIILILTMIFSLFGFNLASYAFVATDFDGGSGTELDPWQIATAVQLNNVRNYLGPEYADQYFILTADIDLGVYPFNEGNGWIPIGNWDSTNDFFYGNFDGGGRTIRNLYINMTDGTIYDYDPVGLFGIVYNATIRNVTLENVDVRGVDCVGGLIGNPENSFISDIHVTGSIFGNDYIGGVLGYTYQSYITFASFYGSVTGRNNIGGLVGYPYSSSVRYSLSKGYVSGNAEVGGLVGLIDRSSVFQSHSESTVTGITYGTTNSKTIGGLIGHIYSNSSVNSSYATGSAIGTDVVGGLVGLSTFDCTITNSYAWGNVSSDADDPFKKVGGLVGSIATRGTVENCYAVGDVSGTGINHGGLVGYNSSDAPILSYSLGPDNGEGSVITSEQMQMASTFVGWNFIDTWVLDEGYPYLLPSGLAEIVSMKDCFQIFVPFGTPFNEVNLPTTAFATLDDTTIVPIQVSWDGSNPTYDGNTPGDYIFTGTLNLVDGIANTDGHTASVTVTVTPPLKEIVSVESLPDIKVPNGTDYYDIAFPSSVIVTLDDQSTASLTVYWDEGTPTYDGNIDITYAFKGSISTGFGILNTAGVLANVNVIVETPPDTPPVIIYHPEDESVLVGESARFSVEFTAKPDPMIQWQFSKNGGKKWSDIPGANSSDYDVTQATVELDDYLYRAILDNGIGSPVTSNAAKLTVSYGAADIQIYQTDGIYDPATNEIVWSIYVHNQGPEAAQGVVVKNTLANSTKLLSVTSDYDYSLKGKTININVGEMEANREIMIQISVLVTKTTSLILNTATVSSTSLDLNLENNESTSEVLIQ
ncbi:MAG: Ig-like domain-containing protein [Bacillota bacterium]|nr:Ig-like domain-containing protein [Bacillota bacterium]